MGVSWTKEQQQVIDTRDRNLLVSAAAGSGKTAVLVARILAMITDEKRPVDIDRLLIVTFTNAAAAEMRERIRDALEKRAEEEPENEHLQRQLVLVHNAKITTIHSFCLHVLRNHFQSIDLDPAFRIADEGEITLLEQDAVTEVLKEAYEEGDDEFLHFLECFSTGKSDQNVEETILQIYHFALGQPDPKKWLEDCAASYETDWTKEQAGTDWLQYIAEDTREVLTDLEAETENAISIANEADGPYMYIPALEADMTLISQLLSGTDYRSFADAFAGKPGYEILSRKKDTSVAEWKRERVKNIRKAVKDQISDLENKYYYDAEEVILQEYQESGRVIGVLVHLTIRFMEYLAAEKAEKNVVDFGDLEHFALQVLADPDVAAEYAESFEEIMIDEYQDSNLVQEILLNRVAGRGKGADNRFMVSDVKQSIYRFRLARPELFMEKYETYREENEHSCRIDLHKNFRSREQVLDSVNDLFRQIMVKKTGGVTYDADAALYPGASFGPGVSEEELQTELLLMQADTSEKQQMEARLVGKRIRELIRSASVWDKDTGAYRPARYGDIVILLRTVSGWSESFREVLNEMGIPCFTGSQTGYFSAAEIRNVLSYLQILDNPAQDIPLATVMRSAMGGFSDEDLAKLRIYGDHIEKETGGRRSFYECCMEYLQNGEDLVLKTKLEDFWGTYRKLRAKCAHTPVHMLLWELLEVTRYGEYIQALPAGEQRKANIDMLIEKAIAYESTSYRGLYHFVRYIENLKKYEIDYGEANIGSEADNTVRIMSIHKSKGLEFPIVFVSGLGKQFNETDIRSRVVLHPELGLACDFADPVLRVRQATLLKRVIQQKLQNENLGEELRVLYVAMTRAKEKLILTGTVADLEKKMEKWLPEADRAGATLSYSCIQGAATYLDWIVPAVLRTERRAGAEASIRMKEVTQAELIQETNEQNSEEAVLCQMLRQINSGECQDEEVKAYLDHVFSTVYLYEKDGDIIGKLSVSDLKRMSHMSEETEAEELFMEETVIPLIPVFRGAEQTIMGAARGTIYHAFMENFDFSRPDDIELQLEEFVNCGKMSQEEAQVLQAADVRRFLVSELGIRMRKAAERGMIFREKPFVLGVPADTIRSDWNTAETVLVQGIIDAYFIEEDGQIVLLDYKTDHVPGAGMLVNRYRAQLDYYAMALERLTGRRVKDRYIYSFHLGCDIRIWDSGKE